MSAGAAILLGWIPGLAAATPGEGDLAAGAQEAVSDAGGESPPVRFTDDELRRILGLSPLPEPPDDPTNDFDLDPRAAHLGRWIFFDERFSGPGTVSCATCHDPGRGWSDGRSTAQAVGSLERHSMTLFNVAYNRWFFWDGRADSLWAQALGPLEDPREHAGSRLAIAHLLGSDADLRRAYEELFGALPDLADAERFPPEGRPVPDDPDHPHARAWSGMSERDREAVNRVFANVGKALAAFERGIVTRRAPFDVFVEGLRDGDSRKERALSEPARRGLLLFLDEARCHVCHAGPLFTDREFHNTRVPPLEGATSTDPGRFRGIELVISDPFNARGPYSDDPDGPGTAKVTYLRRIGHNWGEFKTPTLRNVAVTSPYMHEGQLETLEDVVRYYSTLEDALPTHHGTEKILQPLGLDEGEIADLVAFLESLTEPAATADLAGPPPAPYLESE